MRALLLALLLAGCAHRARVRDPVILRDGYYMLRLEDGKWAIRATSPAALERAKRDIGCGVCADEIVTIHVIESKP